MKIKVFVNLPEDKSKLEDRLAEFHAILLMEKIKQLKVGNKSKKNLLNLILKDLKEKADNER